MDFDDFDDENFFDDLWNLLEEIENEIANLPKERPIFHERQCMSFEDIEIGKLYESVHINKDGSEDISLITVLSDPYLSEFGSWYVDILYMSNKFKHYMSLADSGISQYKEGGWNATNYTRTL